MLPARWLSPRIKYVQNNIMNIIIQTNLYIQVKREADSEVVSVSEGLHSEERVLDKEY